MFWDNSLFVNLLIVTFMGLLLIFKNYFKAVYLAFKIPGPPALPILGNVLAIADAEKLQIIAQNLSQLYGPFARAWISVVPVFIIYEPKHLQILLGTNKYTSKNVFYTFLHSFIGDGLITNTGEKWRQHRKLIQPYFHINVLKVYFDAFFKCSSILIQDLKNETDINIVRFANRFVLNVLQDTVLGIPTKLDQPSPYRQGKLYMPYRITRPWLLLDIIFKRTNYSKAEVEHQEILKNYTRKILENKKSLNNCNTAPLNNLMEMLMEIARENSDFTDEDIIAETCTFMLAGQDSVGAALTFSLYFLAAHQDVQEKVMNELNEIFKSTNRATTFEDLAEMRYLEQCIKETLRLCPSVPMLSRKLTQDLTLAKHVIPRGTNLLIAPYVTHHLPHIYPNPLKFDPERFSPENKDKMHPYAYIPFSAGPRNCIGYKFAMIELKTVISQILTNYHISLIPGHEKLKLSYRITLKAKNGVRLRLKKRCHI